MAKTRSRSRSRSTGTSIVRTISAPAPIIRVSAPSGGTTRRSKGGGRRRSRGGGKGGGALTTSRLIQAGVGGAALGFVDKTFPQLPTIPVLGRAGTIALAAYWLGGKGIMHDIALAGAAIAGYQLGKEGHVSGVVPQLGGIAAQV